MTTRVVTTPTLPRQGPVQPRFDVVSWLLLYVVILYAIPSRLVIPSLASAGAPSMLIGLIGCCLWVLYQIGKPGAAILPERPRPVRQMLFVFLASVAVSFVVAMARPIEADEVSPAMVALLSVLSWSGTLLVANDGVPSLRRAQSLARGLAWAGGLMGLLGLAQFVTGTVLVDKIAIPGLRPAAFEVFLRDGFIRPSGTASHPIEFGIILAMVIPFALHSAYHGSHRNQFMRWAPVVILAAAIALTFSRSAYVSIVVATLILFLGWEPRRRRAFAIGVGGLAVVMFAAVPRLFGTINSLFRNVDNDPSISSRTDSYTLAREFILESPLFGRGLGTFQPKYRIFDNQFLLLAVSIGIVGALAFLMLCLAGIRAALVVHRSARDPGVKDLGLTVAASVAAGTISLATFDGFAFPMTMGTLFLVIGLAGALHRLTQLE